MAARPRKKEYRHLPDYLVLIKIEVFINSHLLPEKRKI